jgi:methionine-gamma-lyase
MILLSTYLPRLGIEVKFVDMNDVANVRAALREKKTAVVYFEPYVNPTCEVLDAPSIIAEAKTAGALCVVDNTWLTPYLFQPLRCGADLVLHSATKYLGGHGSAMGGVVSGNKELVTKIEQTIGVMGGILRPFDAFLVTQGLKTLRMRMNQHTTSAIAVSQFLQSHPKVARVRYGGLQNWNGDKNAASYLRGYGGMLGVEWKDAATHDSFSVRLKLCKPWVSLGDVVTLICRRDAEPNRGIPPRYTRVSVGLEDTADIIADFRQALA